MRSDKFKYLLNLFNKPGPQDDRFVEEILESIRLNHDSIGSKHYDATSMESVDGSVASNTVNGSTVPAGYLFWIPYCEIYHNDAAANHDLVIRIDHTVDVAVCPSANVSDSGAVALTRAVVVPGAGRIRGVCLDGVGAGNQLFLRYYYFQMRPGDYAFPF